VEFANELKTRQAALIEAIDLGDEQECIRRELHLHSLVYEAADHQILLEVWNGLKNMLQLYWASHHMAHDRCGPQRDSHDSFLDAALGDDFSAMEAEIETHMRLGSDITERFLKERQQTT
jgi:DNA-binding GntR family transcriptional regulator